MKFKVGFETDVGRKRSQNQDSGVSMPDHNLFVVSDGMGGHQGGEIASSTAVKVISDHFNQKRKKSDQDPVDMVATAIEKANHAIYKTAQEKPNLQGMGTTTVALYFQDDVATIGHVGDSRCYFLRPGAIWQLTRDHSLVQEKLRAGLIKRSEVRTDKMKNVITRSVGFEPNVEVEIYQMNFSQGDCFLMCSDGLSGLVEDMDILKVVESTLFQEGDAQKAVQKLVAQANENGGDDNITSILIQVV